MIQLILHLAGDYLTQSDWMAQNKTKRFWPAFLHAFIYSLPFLLIGSWAAWSVIFSSHFTIDRYRLARIVVWLKNIFLDPMFWHWSVGNYEAMNERHEVLCWRNCKDTGYPSQSPPWLAVWLLIAADNTLHLAINYCSLRWL